MSRSSSALPSPSPFVVGLVNSDIREWTVYMEEKGGLRWRDKGGVINLAQGVCHVDPFEEKIAAVDAANDATKAGIHQPGWNTYSHFTGVRKLRELIARKIREYNGVSQAALENVMLTNGATGAFTCAVEGLVQVGSGHEVIVFEPFYTYHTFRLRSLGLVPKTVRLRPPDWRLHQADLEAAWSPRTRALVLNTPANPSGKVFSRDELEMIADFCVDHNLWAICDEVYEFMAYDRLEHVSLAKLDGMWKRTVTMQSFSKPLSLTGWRVGSVAAHQDTLRHMGYINEYAYVCAPTPLQHGVIGAFKDWRRFLPQRDVYQAKRDILCNALEAAGLPVYRPSGAIYVLADVSRFHLEDDVAVNYMLIEEAGVGGVPAHGFYTDDTGKQQLRFCFAVTDAMLQEAARRLKAI